MLPNLLIIGAAKAGTSSLHYYLSRHPQIEMSAVKELRFFSHARQWQRGVTWYESQFSGEATIHGESSPSYSMYPEYPDPPARIHALLPRVKLIYVVRDPIDRLISNYVFAYAAGSELAPFAEAVFAPDSRYVAASLYYMQIARYLEWFSTDQILVVSLEDLDRRFAATIARIFTFVGVDETFSTPDFNLRLNTSLRRRKSAFGRQLERLNNVSLVRRIPMRWRVRAGRFLYYPFSTEVPKPVVSGALREHLEQRLRDDVERFRAWTGRTFDEWSI